MMMIDKSANYWVQNLAMRAHPEGGYFVEVYRSPEKIRQSSLPQRFKGDRSFSTSIFYLLERGDFSAFHRIASDETLHFYAGGPLDVHVLDSGSHTLLTLGHDLQQGQHLQRTIKAGAWFAATPRRESPYCLIGCTVAPGFEFVDLEIASRESLVREYPQYSEIVVAYTRVE